MRILLIGWRGETFSGPGTYRDLLVRELGARHEVGLADPASVPPGRWDLAHVLDAGWIEPAALRRLPTPRLAEIHDYYWTRLFVYPCPDLPLRWLNALRLRRRYTGVMREATGIVTHCEYVRRRLPGVTTWNIGLSTAAAVREAPPHATRSDVILFVGTNYFRKGMVVLARAFRRVLARRPTAQLLMVGYERPHSLGAARILCRGLPVHFLGPRPASEIASLYQRARVYVLPSEIEASPVTPLEAAAAGTPSVCTAVGGIPEIVEHGETGLLSPRGDDRQLADNLLACLGDSDLAERLVAGAREALATRFAPAEMIRRLEDVYGLVTEQRVRVREPPG